MDDLPEEVIADTLEGWTATFETKACNVAAYVRNLEAEAAAIEAARKAMESREKALKRHAVRLKTYLKGEIERIGLPKIKNAQLALRVQNNPPGVVVENEQLIPEAFNMDFHSEKRGILKRPFPMYIGY
jgi:outer membrane murein-binding lipoprotein Lpp